MTYTVFDPNQKQSGNQTCFLGPDGGVTIARYDRQKYPIFEKMTEKQLSFFWRPEEVEIYRDANDFKQLTASEQHIFTANLKRQILLDSVQARSPNIALLPLVSLPEIETWIETWAFFETIHSRSYTHIIRNVYADPSIVFDEMLDIQEIVDCASDIAEHYDDLINYTRVYREYTNEANLYELKRRLWLCLNSINILEGIRFYVSFACSWAFAEQKKAMEGNAKIIKLICRDENLHLHATQQLLKILPKEDPAFEAIRTQEQAAVAKMFTEAVDQEKAWAKYLFKDGSMVGLNYNMLEAYVEWIANKRMSAIGVPTPYKGGANPLPWTQKWIAGAEVQVAPQETQITSYTVGAVKQDVRANTFQGFSL